MQTQFTQYLRAFRSTRNLSSRAAAEGAKISHSMWAQYESGSKAGTAGLESLGAYFGCEPEKLEAMAKVPCPVDPFKVAARDAVDKVFQLLSAA